MNTNSLTDYNFIREGGTGFFEQKNGLLEVSGKEAIQFLNGLITNDVKALADNSQMSAAFPNAQGRLLALVRVLRNGDKFLFETDEATHEKVFQNLFRFTFAGDFFVRDLAENYRCFSITSSAEAQFSMPDGTIIFQNDYFIPQDAAESFKNQLSENGAIEISDQLREVLRVENGEPLYGVDMDETTVVLETGLDEAVSFTKGCYIGQEIIARIHFRGHVAKQLRGLVLDENVELQKDDGLKSLQEKAAGKITSSVFSPKLNKRIALGYVRYEFLAENTALTVIHDEKEYAAKVVGLPFIKVES